jgi:hypothetical protein
MRPGIRAVIVGGVLGGGCRSTPPTTSIQAGPSPALAQPTLERCSCARLNAEIEVPADPVELAHWHDVAAATTRVLQQLAPVFGVPCSSTVAADVDRIFDAHQAVLRNFAALDDASCDHFGRWVVRESTEAAPASLPATEALRAGCNLSSAAQPFMLRLLTSQGCTTVSVH